MLENNGETTGEVEVGTTYTWSSVGPTFDGDNGVNVAAPGGAITTVSNWCLQKTQLMNGTSMSSPHATGCVALLISACKAEGIPVSPARIRRAIENTAKPMPGLSTLQQGYGMIQVEAAFEYLKAMKAMPHEDVYFSVSIDDLPGRKRGIYLRQPAEAHFRKTFGVTITPHVAAEFSPSTSGQKERINFEMAFELESNENWVSVPKHFFLMNNGRGFKVEVDPTSLDVGVHTATILGVDSSSSKRRVMFMVPVTVVKPLPENKVIELGELSFEKAEVKRHFLVPPKGSTWADIIVQDSRDPMNENENSTKLIVLHTVQLLPNAAYRDNEVQRYYNLRPKQQVVATIPVDDGHTLEVDLARYWSTAGTTKISAVVKFYGILPVPSAFSFTSGAGGLRVNAHAVLDDITMDPSGKLNKWLTPCRPMAEQNISALGDRDTIPESGKATYQLLMKYKFSMEEKGSFTPRLFPLQGVLYESGLESQLIMAFDENKKYLGSADAWPSSISAEKGDVYLHVQIRSVDPSKLEKLKDVVLWVERDIDSIPLSFYPTKEHCVSKSSTKFKKRSLLKSCSLALFIDEPLHSKLPSGYRNGDILRGTISLAGADSSLPGQGKRPNGFPITYVIGPKAEKVSDSESVEPTDERTEEQKMIDAVRDLKISTLEKLVGKKEDEFSSIYSAAIQEFPDHVPLLLVKARHLSALASRRDRSDEIVATCNEILSRIDDKELARHFGRKSDPYNPDAAKDKKEMKEIKSSLADTLALLSFAFADKDSSTNEFESTVAKLQLWVDIDSSDKYATLAIERDLRCKQYGLALHRIENMLAKNLKEKDCLRYMTRNDLHKKRVEILGILNFQALADFEESRYIIASPNSYPLF